MTVEQIERYETKLQALILLLEDVLFNDLLIGEEPGLVGAMINTEVNRCFRLADSGRVKDPDRVRMLKEFGRYLASVRDYHQSIADILAGRDV